MGLQRFLELHDLARQSCRKYPRKRLLYRQLIGQKGRHFIGIVGARGMGKTVLLRQYASEHEDAFYVSADTLKRDDDAWEIIRLLHEHYGYRVFLVDEIHYLPNFAALLKRLYDFLDIRLIFSSSVALVMQASAYDLSRRVMLMDLHSFSFLEYIQFTQESSPPSLGFDDLINRRWRSAHVRTGRYFDAYLRGGLLPFALEEPEPLGFLERIIETVINKDIPSVARLMVDELEHIRRLIRFVGRSGVDGINYTSLSKNLGITKYKAEQYTSFLEKAFVLHRVFPAGTNVLREPKVLMAPPVRLLYRDWEDAVGGLREDYFAQAMMHAGVRFHYLKSTRGAKTPDYLVRHGGEKIVFEIGGPGKGRQQFKGVTVDRKLMLVHRLTPHGEKVPLFLLGYLR